MLTRLKALVASDPLFASEPEDPFELVMDDLFEDICDVAVLINDCGEWERAQMRACLQSGMFT